MSELPETIHQAIASFNRYRSPEATAEFIRFDNNELVVRFSGSFCQTCGVYDYFEDLIFELNPAEPIGLIMVDFEREEVDSFLVRYQLTYRRPSCAGG
jgi:hypothetical protein